MRKLKILIGFISLFGVLIISVILSLYFGSREVTLSEVLNVVLGIDRESFVSLVILARIPRTVFGLIAGGALGVSGCIMQSVTKNPIADPSVLGVNTGASLAVVIGIYFFNITTAKSYIWFALAGAFVTIVFVYFVASIGESGATPLKLVLSGAAFSTAFSSLISTIILSDQNAMNIYRFWQVGSIGAANEENIKLLMPFFALGTIVALVLSHYLNILALGDEMATSLGVNVTLVRITACIAGVVLCGATTALAGPISFVGLMVPHLLRGVFGSDHRFLMPLSAIAGGELLLISDIIGRVTGRPGETEVGIITAILGAPVFIYVIRKSKVRSL